MSSIKSQIKLNEDNLGSPIPTKSGWGESKFNSPTFGEMDLSEMIRRISFFLKEKTDYNYKLVIGTDSQSNHKLSDFVTAVIVHRVGQGGIYFWQRKGLPTFSLRDRIYKEAFLSLETAQKITCELDKLGSSGLPNLEIHVDIGENGETRELISEVVGMIRSNGFPVKIKPEAFGAATVADRYV
jgi:predicted RNase H-related nuclease YkuK (DUF458 family)